MAVLVLIAGGLLEFSAFTTNPHFSIANNMRPWAAVIGIVLIVVGLLVSLLEDSTDD